MPIVLYPSENITRRRVILKKKIDRGRKVGTVEIVGWNETVADNFHPGVLGSNRVSDIIISFNPHQCHI